MKNIVGLMARLPGELHAELKQLAAQDDRSLNSMMVVLLQEALQARRGAHKGRSAARQPGPK